MKIVSLVLVALACAEVANAQTLYVSVGSPQATNGQIFSYNLDGSRSVFASGLNGPYGLALDANGLLYESELGGSRGVYKFTAPGTRSLYGTVGPTPIGLAFDAGGNLFASCDGGIYEIMPNGNTVRSNFLPGFISADLAIDSSGNLFATSYNGGIIEIMLKTNLPTFFSRSANYGLAFDAHGNLFASSFDTNGNILKFAPDGTLTIFASGLNDPEDLVFDDIGNLYEVDNGSGNIYKFSPSGSRSTFASGLPTGGDGPHALAFSPVPEPSTITLLTLSTIGLLFARRRFIKSPQRFAGS
jgi:DNA-binding beta-propeller fold protein YncE